MPQLERELYNFQRRGLSTSPPRAARTGGRGSTFLPPGPAGTVGPPPRANARPAASTATWRPNFFVSCADPTAGRSLAGDLVEPVRRHRAGQHPAVIGDQCAEQGTGEQVSAAPGAADLRQAVQHGGDL